VTLSQIARQLKKLLQERTFAGVPGNKPVFHPDSVFISVAPEKEAVQDAVQPVCMIIPSEGQVDPEGNGEQPDYFEGTITLLLFNMVEGDALGERSLIGANRDTSTPFGHGILELHPDVYAVAAKVTAANGLTLQATSAGQVRSKAVQGDQGNFMLTAQELNFKAIHTTLETYEAARRFRASVAGGTVSLTWLLPPDRFDTYKPVLRRAAGSTPPASPSAGTGIPLAAGASSKSDTPGAGTWSYSLFMAYDPDNNTPSAEKKYSAAATIAGVSV
jgi:hypothetical protein